MLSRFDFRPQLLVGGKTFRIFESEACYCKGIQVDGIINRRETRPRSVYLRYLNNIEGYYRNGINTLVNFNLIEEKLSEHAATIGLYLSSRLTNTVNIKYLYACTHGYCISDKLDEGIPVRSFLAQAKAWEMKDLMVQATNLYLYLSSFSILAWDLINSCKVYRLNRQYSVRLVNDKYFTTNLVLRLEDYDCLAIRIGGAEFYQLNRILPDFSNSLGYFFNLLEEYNFEVDYQPITVESLDQYSSNKTIAKVISKSRELIYLFENYRPASMVEAYEADKIISIDFNSPLCRNLVSEEIGSVMSLLVDILIYFKKNKFRTEEMDSERNGIGSGVYERRVLEYLHQKKRLDCIDSWLLAVQYYYQMFPLTFTEIERKINSSNKYLRKLSEISSIHRKRIRGDPTYQSYLEAYALL